MLERLFQLDIHKQRTRHLTRCLLIGTLSYNSFLIWWWLLLQDALPWAAAQMLGIATPFALWSWCCCAGYRRAGAKPWPRCRSMSACWWSTTW